MEDKKEIERINLLKKKLTIALIIASVIAVAAIAGVIVGAVMAVRCQSQCTDHCSSDPCGNGLCGNMDDGYICRCTAGYTGENCDVGNDYCSSNPCVNGDCGNTADGYICRCADGYTGTSCDVDIDDCTPNPCANGVCTDLFNGFSCTCNPGYEGRICADGVVECDGVTDISNGECLELEGNGTINKCYAGWFGEDCSCDIDECLCPALNLCHPVATCTNTVGGDPPCEKAEGSYNCTCPPEYVGDGCHCQSDPSCLSCDSSCDLARASTNLTANITVNRSSEDASYPVANLVDGDATTLFKSTSETSPWVRINLGDLHCVHSVTTVKDPLTGTFEDVAINIGPDISSVRDLLSNICVFESGATADTEEFVCAARTTGRYVRITARDVNDVIALYEVYVKGWIV